MRILVVNAGSSSLKLSVLDGDDTLIAAHDFPALDGPVDADRIARTIRGIPNVDAVGHRIVHGGTAFTGPVTIDDDVVARLRALTDLAPLHQPKSLQALDTVSELLTIAGGVIVGCSLKRDGDPSEPVDAELARAFVEAARRS